MSTLRSLLLNRIGSQITLLILASLLVIHAIITASLFLGRDEAWEPNESPGSFVALVQLLAATAADQRPRLIADIAHAFPNLAMTTVAAMPADPGAVGGDYRLRFLGHRLGPQFKLAALPVAPAAATADQLALAVRLPDGQVLTARLPRGRELPFMGGPIAMTILFIVFTITLLGIWAALALRKPLAGFAKAAEGFNLFGDFAPLPERGPEEIRAVAGAFNRMRERIKKLVDDRTRLLAALGHDLRTPITRLRLRSEFVADEGLRRHMLRDLDQMKAMTDGVLSFLRDGQANGGVTTVDLASLLQTICDQFTDMGYAANYHGINHLTITARPDDLQRAVANLVDNAVRHGVHAVVRLAVDATGLCIDVEDDGPGIADEQKPAMLEAFVRGEAARTMDERSGFGLGLSIARAIAEAHGGTLTLHDRVPHGLIARITLPTAHPPALRQVSAEVTA